MKTAIYCSVFTLVSLWTLSVFGAGTCHNNNGGPQSYLYDPADPNGAGGSCSNQLPPGYPASGQYGSAGYPNSALQTAAFVPTAPQGPTARITVVAANASTSPSIASNTHSAKLIVVTDEPLAAPKPVEVAATKPEPEVPAPAIDEKIAGLVGTWKAVARKGDGELTTVELHLDNRGWAELTVPGSDGKPSTTKSRVNFENEELKLAAADKVVSLGKLVEFNTHQMVLERAEGQLTFVRL